MHMFLIWNVVETILFRGVYIGKEFDRIESRKEGQGNDGDFLPTLVFFMFWKMEQEQEN